MDLVTYALCKKLIKTSATGIKSITLDPDDKTVMIFKMGDGQVLRVNLPIKDNCLGYEFCDSLPVAASAKDGILYLVPTDAALSSYKQYVLTGGNFVEVGGYSLPIASATTLGGVMVDDDSIKIDSNGVISVRKDFINEIVDDSLVDQPDISDLFFD